MSDFCRISRYVGLCLCGGVTWELSGLNLGLLNAAAEAPSWPFSVFDCGRQLPPFGIPPPHPTSPLLGSLLWLQLPERFKLRRCCPLRDCGRRASASWTNDSVFFFSFLLLFPLLVLFIPADSGGEEDGGHPAGLCTDGEAREATGAGTGEDRQRQVGGGRPQRHQGRAARHAWDGRLSGCHAGRRSQVFLIQIKTK